MSPRNFQRKDKPSPNRIKIQLGTKWDDKITHKLFIFNGVRELPTVGYTLWQNLGLSVGFPMGRIRVKLKK